MPDSKTYTGGCHCGQVRFECTTDLAMVTACNCSICTKKGLHFTFLDPKSFQLRAGEENLKEYLFNKHAIQHQLCVDCGVDVFARGKKPDGSSVVAKYQLHRRHRAGKADDDAGGRAEPVTSKSSRSRIQRPVSPEDPLLVERDSPITRQVCLNVWPCRDAVAQFN